jgi:MFS family permease
MRSDLNVHARAPSLSVPAVCAIAATALAVAMGIGRFAFTPLLPLMVRDGSLAQSAGAWLAASNYLGYLAGALTVSRLGLSLSLVMRASLAGIVVSTAAMGAFDGLAAWIILRFVAGVLSAYTLISTSAWALQHLTRAASTKLSGIVYAGVGLGIALTGCSSWPALAGARCAGGARVRLFHSLRGPAVGDLRPCAFAVAP